MLNPSRGYLSFQIDYYKGIIDRLEKENESLKKQIRELQEKLKPEEKPLPCPFCGSDPYFFINDFERNFVSCQNTECKVRPSTFSGNKAEVINNWNMRTKK